MSLKFVKPEKVLLSNHPEYREKWVQERIAEDPSTLGLGDLVLKDKERILNRLELTVEWDVVMDKNRPLFSDEERETARWRLTYEN